MKNFRTSQILFICLLICSPLSNAELFKWVDSNGKTHYSDKKPPDKITAESVPVQTTANQDYVDQNTTKVIIRPYEKTARKLLLLDTLYSWKKAGTNRSKKIGVYHIGKGCSSRGSIKTPDVYINHKGFFPKESSLAKRIKKVINSLDYESEYSSKYDLLKKLKRTGGLSLHSEIVDISFNTCAPNTPLRDRLKPINKISAYQFNKHRINLTVHWQLKSERGQTVVYDTTTEGSFNGWNSTNSAKDAISNAVESAAIKLFSDKDFINKIMIEEVNSNQDLSVLITQKPLKRSASINTHKLHLTIDENNWTRQFDTDREIGSFLFGDKCSAKKVMQLKDAGSNQKLMFSSDQQSLSSISSTTSSLGYPNQIAGNNALSDIQQSFGVTLHAEVVSINLNTCAPSLSASSKFKLISEIPDRKFTRKQLKIVIKWSLKTDHNKVLLYQSRTEGLAGSLLIDTKGTQVMQQAIVSATKQLFSDQRFIDKITQKEGKAVKTDTFPVSRTSPDTAIIRPREGQTKKLLLVTNKLDWENIPVGHNAGIYAYSSNCTTYKKKTWPQALNEHPKLFPSAADIVTSASKIIKSLDYPFGRSDQYSVVNKKRKTGAYSLHARIIDLRFDSCAPDISRKRAYNSVKKVMTSAFKRHRVSINVEWQLIGDSEQEVLYETVTQGISNSWLLNAKAKHIFKLAIENATIELFSDQNFIDKINFTQQKQKDDGFFSRFFSSKDETEKLKPEKNQYILQAHLAQVFADINSIKIMLEQHYQMHGKWPDNLDEIGMSHFSSSKTVSSLDIEYDGSIIVELASMFGQGKTLQLTPENHDNRSSMRNVWVCTSNLSQKLLPQTCEQL